MREFEQVLKPTEDVLKLEEDRDNYLSGIVVDVVKKDDKIDCMFHISPQMNPKKGELIVQKTCIDVFGHDPGPDFELFYHDPNVDQKQISLQVMGRDTVCYSMGCTIKYPKSLLFKNLELLKEDLMRRIKVHAVH